MNIFLFPVLKSVYRKEPISSFIFIVGAVDAVMGGVGQRGTLLGLGMMIIFLSIVVRWWKTQSYQVQPLRQQSPRASLPPTSSQIPLPALEKKRSSSR